jgi:hypothetical protein
MSPSEDEALRKNLLKFRSVMVLLAAPHGSRKALVATLRKKLAGKGIKACKSSIYAWRLRVLRWGFAGLVRQARRDRGCMRKAGVLPLIVDAAARVRRTGDLAREFRKLPPSLTSYETFRRWVRSLQQRMAVIEMPSRKAD